MVQVAELKTTFVLADCSNWEPSSVICAVDALGDVTVHVFPLPLVQPVHLGLPSGAPAAVVQAPVSVTVAPTSAELAPEIEQAPVPPPAVHVITVPSVFAVQVTVEGNVIVVASAANPKVATPTATPTRSKVLN